jgi:tRNA dimethylallyltransferase
MLTFRRCGDVSHVIHMNCYNAGMLTGPFATARVLTGPTGSGKTRLALDLAAELGAEIVSMDSMALYRGMDIGTAKPTADERARVPHHLVDVLDPWESASVAWWLQQAAAVCRDIVSRGKTPLFVGGTPLYLKSLMFGLFEGPPADDAFRKEMNDEAARIGSAGLHRRLAEIDPTAANRIHPNDQRRIIRALEVHALTGRRMSDWQQQWPAEPPSTTNAEPRVFLVERPREEMYKRIDDRVDAMFAAGLVDETRRLLALPRPLSREAGKALGYREVIAHLSGEASLDDTITAVKIHTRQFAKRQLTWFRRLPGCFPFTPQLTGVAVHPTMNASTELVDLRPPTHDSAVRHDVPPETRAWPENP